MEELEGIVDDIGVDDKKEPEEEDGKIYGPSDVPPSTFDGFNFVCTGQFDDITRPALEQFLKDKGAKVTGGVSGKTNYLIVGSKLEDGRDVSSSNKYKNA
jgi:NAD-dependent DNA ligase